MASEDKLGERVATTEETVRSHSRRLSRLDDRVLRLEDSDKTLVQLATLVELQTEINKDQNRQMHGFNDTLGKVNDNLIKMNQNQDQLRESLNNVSERVGHIEQTNENYKIDIPKLITRILVGIAMLIPSIILAWVLIQFGLK